MCYARNKLGHIIEVCPQKKKDILLVVGASNVVNEHGSHIIGVVVMCPFLDFSTNFDYDEGFKDLNEALRASF